MPMLAIQFLSCVEALMSMVFPGRTISFDLSSHMSRSVINDPSKDDVVDEGSIKDLLIPTVYLYHWFCYIGRANLFLFILYWMMILFRVSRVSFSLGLIFHFNFFPTSSLVYLMEQVYAHNPALRWSLLYVPI